MGTTPRPFAPLRDRTVPSTIRRDGLADRRNGSDVNCPPYPNADQANADGDGLGDTCDPRVGGGPNRIVLFDPLVAFSTPAWVLQGASS